MFYGDWNRICLAMSKNGKDFDRVLKVGDGDPDLFTEDTGEPPRYSDECPHVVYMEENELYYLFVTQIYGIDSQTTVYASPNPLYFGIDDNTYYVTKLPVAATEIICHDKQYYIASTMPTLDGIRIAKLKWVETSRHHE